MPRKVLKKYADEQPVGKTMQKAVIPSDNYPDIRSDLDFFYIRTNVRRNGNFTFDFSYDHFLR